MHKSPVIWISKGYSGNSRQFGITVVKCECEHLIEEEATEVNRAEQEKPSMACIPFRKFWKTTNNFNKGMPWLHLNIRKILLVVISMWGWRGSRLGCQQTYWPRETWAGMFQTLQSGASSTVKRKINKRAYYTHIYVYNKFYLHEGYAYCTIDE